MIGGRFGTTTTCFEFLLFLFGVPPFIVGGGGLVAPDFLHEHLTVLGLVQTGKGRTLDCGPSTNVSFKRAYYCLPCFGRVSRLDFLFFEVEVAILRLSVLGSSFVPH